MRLLYREEEHGIVGPQEGHGSFGEASVGNIMDRYHEASQAQLGAVHGAVHGDGLSPAEAERIRQGLQDDVVKVKVGRSVQSVYGEVWERSSAEGGVPGGTGQECSGEEGHADGGECSAPSEEPEQEADESAERGISDAYYYDAYFNATGGSGQDDMEYYDDYLFLGSEEA